MKKLLLVLLSGLIITGLSACGTVAKGTDKNQVESQSEKVTGKNQVKSQSEKVTASSSVIPVPTKIDADSYCILQKTNSESNASEREKIDFSQLTYQIDDGDQMDASVDYPVKVPSGSSATFQLNSEGNTIELKKGDVLEIHAAQNPVKRLQISLQSQSQDVTAETFTAALTAQQDGSGEFVITNCSSEVVYLY